MSRTQNVISVSGGKDSTAMILLALERRVERLHFVFADTGHEHEDVYEYLDYLEFVLNIVIKRVRADFSEEVERKRRYVEVKWREEGVEESVILEALDVLKPTGNPFLDLCLVKGRFPSSMAQFCTGSLKTEPILSQVLLPLHKEFGKIRSWQGIRAGESRNRAKKKMHERLDLNMWAYRPLLHWTVEDVFSIHKKFGVDPNPLYKKGMGRVGCMPCINCRKGELSEISLRFPEVIDKLRLWEELVSKAAKRRSSTFFRPTDKTGIIDYKTHGIDQAVAWSRTERGGSQFLLFNQTEALPSCSSNYGLCEVDN